MQNRPSADRTRSRRWRSGTRRNKKYRTAHLPVCVKRRLCIVHTSDVGVTVALRVAGYAGAAMAMRLTACEQRWVDDIRARRPHAACRLKTARWQAIDRMNGRLRRLQDQLKREAQAHTHLAMNRTPGGIVAGLDFGYGSSLSAAIEADARHAREAIMSATAQYPRRMDISDRWYPRGE